MGRVIVSAKDDYALRAVVELAAAGEALNAETIALRQGIPTPFLRKILNELQSGRIVVSRRGHEGGHRLARPAAEITIADVLRAVEGAPAAPPAAPATRLDDVWAALRENVRSVLDQVTLADLVEDPALHR